MTIYNKHSAHKLWLDVRTHKQSRNTNRYVQAPNPGRPGIHSVSLYALLKKTHVERDFRKVKSQILNGDLKVNGNRVKQLKYPVHYLDYLTLGSDVYQVVFQKPHQCVNFSLHKVLSSQWVCPVLKWYLKDGLCMVNTYQNKIFKFEPSEQLFTRLRFYDSYIQYDSTTREYCLKRLTEVGPIKLLKLSGQSVYGEYLLESSEERNQMVHLTLKNVKTQAVCKTSLYKCDFRKRYVCALNEN